MKDKYKSYYQEIGERIIFYRTRRGMSQEELALQINCSPEYLNQIENYDVNSDFSWSIDLLFAISDALKINILIFLGCF
ncbi:helix-turn-helix transcriptional regulator|uniref:Helix-turn-helix n=1 Tax=Dendrosporobacter quercicolus TaxID=146817 RepID=A0A1G9W1U1_9FIRM|nr:helix-turn-helix transcriptional regulator [Dendrosporobacter quercicolus]NSL47749.1 helix-turn-helix transcriptional regulator [Dendrosporobacter quercicolus DSM 1736]SDM78161.1 Helix-turn-helix [Dendrosporobacter quercicolus]